MSQRRALGSRGALSISGLPRPHQLTSQNRQGIESRLAERVSRIEAKCIGQACFHFPANQELSLCECHRDHPRIGDFRRSLTRPFLRGCPSFLSRTSLPSVCSLRLSRRSALTGLSYAATQKLSLCALLASARKFFRNRLGSSQIHFIDAFKLPLIDPTNEGLIARIETRSHH